MLVVAVSTTVNTVLAPILARRRDKKLAAGTAQVAVKAAEVAEAVVAVKTELDLSKGEVAAHRIEEARAFGDLKDVTNKTHVIVNSQKTEMLQDALLSRKANLNLAKLLLKKSPHDQDVKEMVKIAEREFKRVSDLLDVNKGTC